MPLIARCMLAFTALLGAALMAVSAYAAKTEPVATPPDPAASDGAAAVDGSAYEYVLLGGLADLVPAAEKVETEIVAKPTPGPTVEIHYAAPDDVPAVTGASGRDNLSAGAHVWEVVSLKPDEVDLASLGSGGFEVPADQLRVMLDVSHETGIPWQVFAGIAKTESDFGRNMATSWAGAIGYGQFLPESWALYGNGGDPYDFRDAIPAMGRFLLDAGVTDDVSGALYTYNHSWPYVAQVLSYATSYGYSALGQTYARPGGQQLIWPVYGPISSYFGPDHPLGIDIDQMMAVGAPVLAAHDGVVVFAGGDPCCSYGYYVIVMGSGGMTTLYAHFEVLMVGTGQAVVQGEPLGIVGSTGYSTGTHLHFEVIDGGIRRNPLDYLP